LPFNASFIIVTFELTILFGGISAAVGMLALNGLPLPYHRYSMCRIQQASDNGFFWWCPPVTEYDAAAPVISQRPCPPAVSEVPS